jgi:hypothetical protein
MVNASLSPSSFTRRGINFLRLYSRGKVYSPSPFSNGGIPAGNRRSGSHCHLYAGVIASAYIEVQDMRMRTAERWNIRFGPNESLQRFQINAKDIFIYVRRHIQIKAGR